MHKSICLNIEVNQLKKLNYVKNKSISIGATLLSVPAMSIASDPTVKFVFMYFSVGRCISTGFIYFPTFSPLSNTFPTCHFYEWGLIRLETYLILSA